MIVSHEFNKKLSVTLYKELGDKIQPKQCYNNVFNVLTNYPKMFHSGKWSIAYGFVNVFPGLFARHCFIVDTTNGAIDPTLVSIGRENEKLEYVSFKLLKHDEYIELVENDNLMPALYRPLRKYELEANEWANKRGIILLG